MARDRRARIGFRVGTGRRDRHPRQRAGVGDRSAADHRDVLDRGLRFRDRRSGSRRAVQVLRRRIGGAVGEGGGGRDRHPGLRQHHLWAAWTRPPASAALGGRRPGFAPRNDPGRETAAGRDRRREGQRDRAHRQGVPELGRPPLGVTATRCKGTSSPAKRWSWPWSADISWPRPGPLAGRLIAALEAGQASGR